MAAVAVGAVVAPCVVVRPTHRGAAVGRLERPCDGPYPGVGQPHCPSVVGQAVVVTEPVVAVVLPVVPVEELIADPAFYTKGTVAEAAMLVAPYTSGRPAKGRDSRVGRVVDGGHAACVDAGVFVH